MAACRDCGSTRLIDGTPRVARAKVVSSEPLGIQFIGDGVTDATPVLQLPEDEIIVIEVSPNVWAQLPALTRETPADQFPTPMLEQLTKTSVRVSWNPALEGTGFDVQAADDAMGTNARSVATGATGGSTDDTGLDEQSTHFYRLGRSSKWGPWNSITLTLDNTGIPALDTALDKPPGEGSCAVGDGMLSICWGAEPPVPPVPDRTLCGTWTFVSSSQWRWDRRIENAVHYSCAVRATGRGSITGDIVNLYAADDNDDAVNWWPEGAVFELPSGDTVTVPPLSGATPWSDGDTHDYYFGATLSLPYAAAPGDITLDCGDTPAPGPVGAFAKVDNCTTDGGFAVFRNGPWYIWVDQKSDFPTRVRGFRVGTTDPNVLPGQRSIQYTIDGSSSNVPSAAFAADTSTVCGVTMAMSSDEGIPARWRVNVWNDASFVVLEQSSAASLRGLGGCG